MFNTAVSSNSAYKVSTGFARRLLITVAAIALAPVAVAQSNGGSSQKPAFGTMGTMINGVNDRGDFVGFFSDGTKVNGFVNFAPASEREDEQNNQN